MHITSVRHPGLWSVLAKLRQRKDITEEDSNVLRRQLMLLQNATLVAMPESFVEGNATVATPLDGHATRQGTSLSRAEFGPETPGFYSVTQNLLMSSIGIGTSLGAGDDKTDASYVSAVHSALELGLNVVDTSINYRRQRSELSVGEGVRRFIEFSGGKREGIVICTKGGYMVPGAFARGTVNPGEISRGTHSIAPNFLIDQIERSRRNLGLKTIDVYYLHNPEMQTAFVEYATFIRRIRVAFETLERAVSDGLICYYGAATWDGFLNGALDLPMLVGLANQIAGDSHHFRFVQLPVSLAIQEAFTRVVKRKRTILEIAGELGVSVISNSPLLQGRLSLDLPKEISELMPELATDSHRAIHFARSTPGVTSSLVGMSDSAHVIQNVKVSQFPKLTYDEYKAISSRSRF